MSGISRLFMRSKTSCLHVRAGYIVREFFYTRGEARSSLINNSIYLAGCKRLTYKAPAVAVVGDKRDAGCVSSDEVRENRDARGWRLWLRLYNDEGQ